MKKKIVKIIGLIVLFYMNTVNADTIKTIGNKSTATLVASCQINAQSISFGVLMLPLMTQSATSNLNVLCNKEAAYKIDMSFGLSANYWQVRTAGGRWADSTWTATTSLYDGSGNVISSSAFSYPAGGDYNAYLATAMKCTYTADGKCHATSGSSNNGVMIGSKDSVAYTIFIPGDTSKVWNIGKNSYLGTGTGLNQSIPVQAQIVPSASSAYPAPDMYSDTVVATITY